MIDRIQNGEIIVIDNFLSAEQCQKIVKDRLFYKGENSNYQGRISDLTDEELLELQSRIEKLIGVEIEPIYSRIRVANENDQASGDGLIHIDPHPVVSVVYLSPYDDHQMQYGTRFYEYIHNKKKRFDFTDGVERFKWNFILGHHRKDLSQWRMWNTVEYKMGRLVLFYGGYLHAPPAVCFGKDDATGRANIEIFSRLKEKS